MKAGANVSRSSLAEGVRSGALLFFALAQAVAGRFAELTGYGVPIATRSHRTQGPATPSDGAFAIWAPLFLTNMAWALRAAGDRRPKNKANRRVEWLALLAFLGNTAWAVQAEFKGLGYASLAIISATAAAASIAFIEAERNACSTAARALAPLAGWLTIATFANASASWIEAYGRPDPRIETRRSVALVAAATATAGAMVGLSGGNFLYAGAAGWGLGGIWMRNIREENRAVAAAAGLGMLALGLTTVLSRRTRSPAAR